MDNIVVNERTSIQLWGVATVIIPLMTGVFFLTTIYTDGLANAHQVAKLEERVDKQMNLLLEVNDRLIRIEQNQHERSK